ncbi:hypothetical protein T07_10140 [Trichinella nelsoni]|uniref:Uncharacterized protein n=1 Tax=Trichinella nelsoni TaxID=6336 RepID=A0A0V0RWK0_9BILA|nr:hypothetical protein T07_10140 [Trichinella nelsoni]
MDKSGMFLALLLYKWLMLLDVTFCIRALRKIAVLLITALVANKTVEFFAGLLTLLFVFLYSTDWSMSNHFVKIRSICGIKQYPNVSQMNLLDNVYKEKDS